MALMRVVFPAPIGPQNATILRPLSEAMTSLATSFSPSSESTTISFIQKTFPNTKVVKEFYNSPNFGQNWGDFVDF
jgi:hypothetical protein